MQIKTLENARPITKQPSEMDNMAMFSAKSGSVPFGSCVSHPPPTPDKIKPVGEEELSVAQSDLKALGQKETELEAALREVVVQRVAEREKAAAMIDAGTNGHTETRAKQAEKATRTRQPLPKESKPSDFEVLKQLGKGAFGTVSMGSGLLHLGLLI